MSSYLLGLACRECGAAYPAEARSICDECFGPLEATYDLERLRSEVTRETIEGGPASLWRYQPLLPATRDPWVDLGDGFTPLRRAERLGAEFGLPKLYLKDETRNPTHSFKDRVVSVALARARELGFDTVGCASTGNLANAVAAHAAAAGLRAVILVPAGLEAGKIASTAVYGAALIEVDGTYDDANRLSGEAADEFGWAFVNVSLRPYYVEGSKTIAFETAEQLGWRAPDHVVVPVASGALLTRVGKGFRDLHEAGLLEEEPNVRVSGAQAAGCGPVAEAFERGTEEIRPVRYPDTIAKSLAIGDPADGVYALREVRSSSGAVAAVSDEEIVEAVGLLARTEGLFTETAGGVTVATLSRLAVAGVIRPDETVVAYITGMGLKTLEAFGERFRPARTISPKLEALAEALPW
ncbi:MAG TPA: threonine synthase [Actinomycetota bacterium]|jgi:threonine synthase|nr:threonine synthase [Actinomycetota bacterium]